jgi:hypothetical protein
VVTAARACPIPPSGVHAKERSAAHDAIGSGSLQEERPSRPERDACNGYIAQCLPDSIAVADLQPSRPELAVPGNAIEQVLDKRHRAVMAKTQGRKRSVDDAVLFDVIELCPTCCSKPARFIRKQRRAGHRVFRTLPQSTRTIPSTLRGRFCGRSGSRSRSVSPPAGLAMLDSMVAPAALSASATEIGRERCGAGLQASLSGDDGFQPPQAGGAQHFRAQVRRLEHQSRLGFRHHLSQHGRRLVLSRRGDGSGQPADRRLVDEQSAPRRPDLRCAESSLPAPQTGAGTDHAY